MRNPHVKNKKQDLVSFKLLESISCKGQYYCSLLETVLVAWGLISPSEYAWVELRVISMSYSSSPCCSSTIRQQLSQLGYADTWVWNSWKGYSQFPGM